MNYDTVIFRRKTILFFVFSFCILLFCGNDAVAKPEIDVNMEKAAEILNSAFRKVYDLDVIGTVANPVICSPVRESMSIPGIVPEFSKFRVYRKKKKDGCFDLRVEMMVKDSLFAVAI